MIHAMNGAAVLDNLQSVISPGSGIEHWGSSYFGPRYSTNASATGPQALITEMSANETILPHFHGVTQFQIFPSGSGMMAKQEIRPLMLQTLQALQAVRRAVARAAAAASAGAQTRCLCASTGALRRCRESTG